MKTFSQYIDQFNCICRLEYNDKTGGDSLSYRGWYHTNELLSYDADKETIGAVLRHSLSTHSTEQGVYIRHPRPDKNWSSIYKASRDQYMPSFCALALLGDYKTAWKLMKPIIFNKINRPFFMFNICREEEVNWDKDPSHWTTKKKLGDFFGFEQFGIFLRSMPVWSMLFLYPILCVLDIFSVLSTIWKVIYSWIYPSHTDDQTRFTIIATSLKKYTTPFSILAAIIYHLRASYNAKQIMHLDDLWFFSIDKWKIVWNNYSINLKQWGYETALNTRFGQQHEPPFNEQVKQIKWVK